MAFSHDNKSAFISEYGGNIRMIKWQAGANSGDDFDFTEEPRQVGKGHTGSICFTKDEKYLLVGSSRLVSVFETETRTVTKEFKLTNYIQEISLIRDGKHALIAESNSNLSIIDLETLKISSIAKNITNDKQMYKIKVI